MGIEPYVAYAMSSRKTLPICMYFMPLRIIEGNGGGRCGSARESSIGGCIGSYETGKSTMPIKLRPTHQSLEYPPRVKNERESGKCPEERLLDESATTFMTR